MNKSQKYQKPESEEDKVKDYKSGAMPVKVRQVQVMTNSLLQTCHVMIKRNKADYHKAMSDKRKAEIMNANQFWEKTALTQAVLAELVNLCPERVHLAVELVEKKTNEVAEKLEEKRSENG
ncbi:hypothetical protein [Peijinzhouia sedimentorum]